MTNGKGEDRLERIERILEDVASSQKQLAASQQQFAASQQQFAASQQQLADRQQQLAGSLEQLAAIQQEMSARQRYHDEAFERMDVDIRELKEAIAVDSENIRALARIAEIHNRRLTDLEGGEQP